MHLSKPNLGVFAHDLVLTRSSSLSGKCGDYVADSEGDPTL